MTKSNGNARKRKTKKQSREIKQDISLGNRLRRHKELKDPPIHTSMTVKKLCAAEVEGRIYTDKRMQRRKVWSTIQQHQFIRSINRNGATSTIVLADIGSCLMYSKGIQDWDSVKYFQELKDKGFKYISIDGQQRTRALVDFFDGKFDFEGVLFHSEKAESIVIQPGMTWDRMLELDDIDTSYQDSVEGRDIPVVVIRSATYADLCDFFFNAQQGEPLNEQEKRNCLQTQLAEVVRQTADSNSNLWYRVHGFKDLERMEDHDFVAWFQTFESKRFELPINQGNITAFYTKGVADYDGNKENYSRSALDSCALKLQNLFECFPFSRTMFDGRPYVSPKRAFVGFYLFLTIIREDACDLGSNKEDLWDHFVNEDNLRMKLIRKDCNGEDDKWYDGHCRVPHNAVKLEERFEKIKADYLIAKPQLEKDGLIVSLTKVRVAPISVSELENLPCAVV